MNLPGGVTRGGQDLSIAEETAARQVTWVGNRIINLFYLYVLELELLKKPLRTCVCVQLPEGLGAGGLDVVDRADVVQTPAGHQVTGGGKGNAHHPGRL